METRKIGFRIKSAAFLIIAAVLNGCGTTQPRPKTVHFTQVAFKTLNGWDNEDQLSALIPLKRSCARIIAAHGEKEMNKSSSLGGQVKDWKPMCNALSTVKTLRTARKFWETWFVPYVVSNEDGSCTAKFTGYCLLELKGSKKKLGPYKFPVYKTPKNIKEDRGQHHMHHASINRGSLRNMNLEIAWVDNRARLFFAHIQGSGVIKLHEGGEILIGCSYSNGFRYKSIDNHLKAYDAHKKPFKEQLEWLNTHPMGLHIMEQNPSYVFFEPRAGAQMPCGAEGVELEPMRSIAVDSNIFPYGTPFWIEATAPASRKGVKQQKYSGMFIAQDRGGAIKGPLRADIFTGRGELAEEIASRMYSVGKYYVFFPRNVKVPKSITVRRPR